MKVNRYYKSLAFITVISLSFCLFIQKLHASETSEAGACGDVLISIPSVLKPVGASNNTEMIETSTIGIHGLTRGMLGTFSFLFNQQKREIEIEYKFNGVDDERLLSRAGFKFLKEILDAMPAKLLSKVNRVTFLITEERRLMENEALKFIFPERESRLKEELQSEEAHYNPVSNEITLVIPYSYSNYSPFVDDSFISMYVGLLYIHLIYRMQHKLGHVMAYHRYGQLTPDQEWHDAILKDNESVSTHSDTNMAEDFAEAMALYLSTNAGINHPEITRNYAHRFKILDEEAVGVTFSERQRITERNRALEERIREINHLLELLGIVNNEGRVYEDKDEAEYIGIREDSLEGIRELLLESNGIKIKMLRKLAEKVLILHRNKPLDFTSLNASSVRENLIRKLVWPGLLLMPENNEANIPQFIVGTIDLLETLSTSEVERRLYIFNETLKAMEQMEYPGDESYIIFERAFREVQGRVN